MSRGRRGLLGRHGVRAELLPLGGQPATTAPEKLIDIGCSVPIKNLCDCFTQDRRFVEVSTLHNTFASTVSFLAFVNDIGSKRHEKD